MGSIVGEHYTRCILLIWSLYLSPSNVCTGLLEVYEKECQGSEVGLRISCLDDIRRYEEYRKQYENCTLVISNLEIVFMQLTDVKYDFSFLETILEVRGYVLIYGNSVNRIRLNGLRVIRGWRTFPATENGVKRQFSLYVAGNVKLGDDSIGLKELQLTSLVEIMRGDVLFKGNAQLCLGETTINWNYTKQDNLKGEVIINTSGKTRMCDGTCHANCTLGGGRYCWGEGPDMCQAERPCRDCRRGCSRCFCDSECIGGCTGSYESTCVACRNFVKGDRCVDNCNAAKYNQHNQEWYFPPKTYMFGSKCVAECPDNILIQHDACVTKCMPGYMENKKSNDRKCVPCKDGICPKSCDGTAPWLHGNNLAQFNQCTTVEGSLIIKNNSFKGDHVGPSIQVDDLKLLKDIEEIKGILDIDVWHPNLTSLSFLRNLRVIGGNGAELYSLTITMTPLRALDLKSLRKIKKGGVYIVKNDALCYAHTINWTTIILASKDNEQKLTVELNANSSRCDEQGKVCSHLCSDLGCWGRGNDNCLSCRSYFSEGRCVSNCSDENVLYWFKTENKTNRCGKCHEECRLGCTGDGPEKCKSCRHVRDKEVCRSECPQNSYSDLTGTCQWCDCTCKNCTGNSSRLGNNGCNSCVQKVLLIKNESEKYCLKNVTECNETHFRSFEYVNTTDGMVLMETCRKCHPECDGCQNGNKSTDCIECQNYKQRGFTKPKAIDCVSSCSYDDGYYHAGKKVCQPCHSECKRCNGSTNYDCLLCLNVRVYHSRSQSYCAEKCPLNQTAIHQKVNEAEAFCSVVNINPLEPKYAVAIVVFLFLIIAIVIVTFVVFWRKHKLRKLKDSVLANDEIPMINANKATPDMSLLRLVKDSELRRGNKIGSGAFGTVYKGIWIPEKENVKIPVAIKVLKESSNTSQNVELLDEARIMASVCNPYCVRILAVCLTAQMMLITQLMPLGCLLDYVRKEKSNIGSRALLLWSVQIAKGMKYLEDLGIVHRDLAARNVLVQKPNQVKITDFGLAKLVDDEEEEIHSEGERMPLKWLALECIQHRIYTHKSDVWSYGVTLWEMFTYGEKPYENISNRQIPQALEKGERLPQPNICTIDVYMIMLKCWMLNVDSRPGFSDLVNEFTRMAQDPGRFLAIPGDKLMRLPTTVPDAKDLVSQMCLPVDEPDLIVVSGDDYFRPRDLNLGGNASSVPAIPSRPGPLATDQTIRMDEDGYLSPQSATTAPSYLDVVYCPENGSIDSQNKQDPLDNQQPQYLDMRPSTGLTKDDLECNKGDAKHLTTSGSDSANNLGASGSSEKSNQNGSEYGNDP